MQLRKKKRIGQRYAEKQTPALRNKDRPIVSGKMNVKSQIQGHTKNIFKKEKAKEFDPIRDCMRKFRVAW